MRNIFEYHDEGIYLEHHGILGQKWGIRRFQNADGTLTAEGKKRYLNSEGHFQRPDSLRRSVKKQDLEVQSKYYERLNREAKREYSELKQLKGEEKARAEEEFLKSATASLDDADDLTGSRYGIVMQDVNEKSGDWYMSKPVSKRNAEALSAITKQRKANERLNERLRQKYELNNVPSLSEWSKRYDEYIHDPLFKQGQELLEKAMQKMDAAVLEDIGFENTEANRRYIRYVWYWD